MVQKSQMNFLANPICMDFPVAQKVKNRPMMQEIRVRSLGWENPLEKGMIIHSKNPSILAWRIPWTEKPGGLQSMGLQRVGHYWATNTHNMQGGQSCEQGESEAGTGRAGDVHKMRAGLTIHHHFPSSFVFSPLCVELSSHRPSWLTWCCCSVSQSCLTLRPQGLQHTRLPLSFTISRGLLKPMAI